MLTRDHFSDRVEAAIRNCREKRFADRAALIEHTEPSRPRESAGDFSERIEAALQKLRPPAVSSSPKHDATVDRAVRNPDEVDPPAALPPIVSALVQNWASISPAAREIVLQLARAEMSA